MNDIKDIEAQAQATTESHRQLAAGAAMKEEMVRKFYEKNGLVTHADLSQPPGGLSPFDGMDLKKMARIMLLMANKLALDYSNHGQQQRMLRASMHVEETAELLLALEAQDAVATLDALVDIDYINTGTAMMFDLPLGAGFSEVHRSNMTKSRTAEDTGRLKEKGEDYVAPDLKTVLEWHDEARRDAYFTKPFGPPVR